MGELGGRVDDDDDDDVVDDDDDVDDAVRARYNVIIPRAESHVSPVQGNPRTHVRVSSLLLKYIGSNVIWILPERLRARGDGGGHHGERDV